MTGSTLGKTHALTCGALLACLLWSFGVGDVPGEPVAASTGQSGQPVDAIRATIAAEISGARAGLPPAEGQDLATFYAYAGGGAAWLSADGTPGSSAQRALAMLATAEEDGLSSADYGVEDLTRRLSASPTPSPTMAAAFDVRLTAAVLRYYRHLHFGRVDPRSLGVNLRWPPDTHDLAAELRTALADGRIVERARELAPRLTQYALLRAELRRYRQLAASSVDGPRLTTPLRPGDTAPTLSALHRLLITVGDLAPDEPVSEQAYDERLVAAVRRFQARHGLDVDGVIGPATQAAMAVPLNWRVRQFEFALERLRWLPDLTGGRLLAVNIPTFQLFAWNGLPSVAPPALSMKVVVGRAMRTETPVFADQMEYVIFRPYWNVPASILRGELLPAIRRDPAYLTRQNLEIVRGDGDQSPVLAATPAHIAQLGQAGVRLRQRPGPGNALGLVKFMFPNDSSVYMHDTPAAQLFDRSRRDFSHGCIRVEDPIRLAEWVLADLPDWGREAVRAAMHGAPNHRVDLPHPVQVVIFYTTVVVQPEDGAVHFAADIYGHDRTLDMAL